MSFNCLRYTVVIVTRVIGLKFTVIILYNTKLMYNILCVYYIRQYNYYIHIPSDFGCHSRGPEREKCGTQYDMWFDVYLYRTVWIKIGIFLNFDRTVVHDHTFVALLVFADLPIFYRTRGNSTVFRRRFPSSPITPY